MGPAALRPIRRTKQWLRFLLKAEVSRMGITSLFTVCFIQDLGMDDTRINLLGGDDDGGRSVPTTPLQTHAPGRD